MKLLITRTAPQAEATAEHVRAMGAEAVVAPVLRVRIIQAETHVPDLQAVAFTSVNGVMAFVQQSGVRQAPAFCVGDATAEAAHQAGFATVLSADGDVTALAHLIETGLSPAGGTILHAAGRERAGDLAGALRARGFKAEARVLYATEPVHVLPDAALDPDLDGVLFHSPRGAEVFAALAGSAPMGVFARLNAACLSPAVAEKAAALAWKRIIVASFPREDALLTAALAQTGAKA